MFKTRIIAIVFMLLVVASSIPATCLKHGQEEVLFDGFREYIGYSKKIVIKEVPENESVKALANGTIDLYGHPVSSEIYLKGVKNITRYKGFMTTITGINAPLAVIDVLFNPAPIRMVSLKGNYTREEAAKVLNISSEAISFIKAYRDSNGVVRTYIELGAYPGRGINPFAFREIRRAINNAINRTLLEELLRENNILASKEYTIITRHDLWYPSVVDIIVKYGIDRYDYRKAFKIIYDKLTSIGAEYVDGKWYYEGKPVILNAVIPTYDKARLVVGEYISEVLEDLGFTVNKTYVENYRSYFEILINTFAIAHKWHLAIEKWKNIGISKDAPLIALHTYATYIPGSGPVPVWGGDFYDTRYWVYRNKTVLDTIDFLFKVWVERECADEETILEYLRRGLDLTLSESIRVTTVVEYNVVPYATSFLNPLRNVVNSGIDWNYVASMPVTYRTVFVSNRTYVKIGYPDVREYGYTFNIFTYGKTWTAVYDPLIIVNPFTGERVPYRATIHVKTATGNNYFTVPPNAVIWDPWSQKWVYVREKEPNATAEVIIEIDLSNIIGSKWHHGIKITWADVIASFAYITDISYKIVYGLSLDPSLEKYYSSDKIDWILINIMVERIKGIVFDTKNNKVILYIRQCCVYDLEKTYYVLTTISLFASPIEVYAGVKKLAIDYKKYVIGIHGSPKYILLNLLNKTQAEELLESLETIDFSRDVGVYITINKTAYMTIDEWEERVNALKKWFSEHGHLVISQGPYYIDKYYPGNKTLVLLRFTDGYPLPPYYIYSVIGRPVVDKPSIDLVYKVNEDNKTKIYISVKGEPDYILKYFIRSTSSNKIIYSGEIKSFSNIFVIEVNNDTSDLELVLILYSNVYAESLYYSVMINDILSYTMRPIVITSPRISEYILSGIIPVKTVVLHGYGIKYVAVTLANRGTLLITPFNQFILELNTTGLEMYSYMLDYYIVDEQDLGYDEFFLILVNEYLAKSIFDEMLVLNNFTRKNCFIITSDYSRGLSFIVDASASNITLVLDTSWINHMTEIVLIDDEGNSVYSTWIDPLENRDRIVLNISTSGESYWLIVYNQVNRTLTGIPIRINVDKVKPLIMFAVKEINDTAVYIKWSIIDDTIVANASLTIDSTNITIPSQGSMVLNIGEGEHELLIKAVDIMGKTSTYSRKIVLGLEENTTTTTTTMETVLAPPFTIDLTNPQVMTVIMLAIIALTALLYYIVARARVSGKKEE
ncbi:hypothetical protein J4526_07880 [Desulfurococcaceae archaeon MEX13E-LK6-19]|nr:hypothetical protein J4526_07880 [Desulfurococcaceae archaeon MEX13E-LK6-19]